MIFENSSSKVIFRRNIRNLPKWSVKCGSRFLQRAAVKRPGFQATWAATVGEIAETGTFTETGGAQQPKKPLWQQRPWQKLWGWLRRRA